MPAAFRAAKAAIVPDTISRGKSSIQSIDASLSLSLYLYTQIEVEEKKERKLLKISRDISSS